MRNKQLEEAYSKIYDCIRMFRSIPPIHSKTLIDDHISLIKALKDKDIKKAKKLTEVHIEKFKKLIEKNKDKYLN